MTIKKLFSFDSPIITKFAEASRLGTWHPIDAKVCPECGDARQKRIPPLIIEWEPGSDVIGDFTWPGFNLEVVVSQKVKEAFEVQFPEVGFASIQFWQNPRLTRPALPNKRTKPRVWLPYSGSDLWEIIPQKWFHLDCDKSNVVVEKQCSTCGKIIYKKRSWTDRFVIDDSSWEGENIFRIYEYPGPIYCTEDAKIFIEKSGFSNIRFSEEGEIRDQL
jgi:hypothetical protein